MSDHSPGHPAVAVIDIDGVLADVRHRLHHLSGRRRDWSAFFDAAADDRVLPEGRTEIERALREELAIVYLTGRPERCRQSTLTWLHEHGFPPAQLLMRADGDRRPARTFKVDALTDLSAHARIARVVDDDEAVVAAVIAAGFPVVHADWMPGGDAESLASAQERLGRT